MEFPWINLQWIYRKILKSSFVHWTEFTLQTFPPSMVHRHVWFQWLAKDDGFGCHLCGMWDGLHPVSNTLFPAPGWLQLAKVLTNKAAIKSFSGMSIVTFFLKDYNWLESSSSNPKMWGFAESYPGARPSYCATYKRSSVGSLIKCPGPGREDCAGESSYHPFFLFGFKMGKIWKNHEDVEE